MIAIDHIALELAKRNLKLWTFPGGTIYPLYDACHRHGVETIVCRSEAGCGYAAIGAAKATGEVQVVATTSGPGATNIVTPCADAYYDSAPVVFLTGQVGSANVIGYSPLRQRGFQETHIKEIVKPIVKYVHQCFAPNSLVKRFIYALDIANELRCGPALIDMPMDVQKGEYTGEFNIEIPPYAVRYSNVSRDNLYPLSNQLSQLELLLASSSRPVILVGAGCRGGIDQLRALVERLGIPTVSSLPAVGFLPTNSPYYFGMVGHTGHPGANLILQRSDLVIALGARLDVRQTGTETDAFVKDKKIVRIDIDKNELDCSRVAVDLAIHARCEDVLDWLLKRNKYDAHTNWRYECETTVDGMWSAKFVQREIAIIMESISEQSPEDCIFVTGVGSHQQHAARHLNLDYPRRQFITSSGHGCMGAGLPMAIGCAISTGRKICLIDGDGSFQMSMNELGTVASRDLDIDIHIINNRCGGIVSQFARLQGYSPQETTWPNPDFNMIADAYGLNLTVHDCEDEGVWPIMEGGRGLDDMTWSEEGSKL